MIVPYPHKSLKEPDHTTPHPCVTQKKTTAALLLIFVVKKSDRVVLKCPTRLCHNSTHHCGRWNLLLIKTVQKESSAEVFHWPPHAVRVPRLAARLTVDHPNQCVTESQFRNLSPERTGTHDAGCGGSTRRRRRRVASTMLSLSQARAL
eukprot:193761-Hanusia_phi.AAC.1